MKKYVLSTEKEDVTQVVDSDIKKKYMPSTKMEDVTQAVDSGIHQNDFVCC